MPAIETRECSVIALDGESKVCKTSVMDDMAAHLSEEFIVITGDAGRFFRIADHDAQVEMGGVTGKIGPPYDRLDAALGRVIASGVVFDPAIDRGDLERPEIADTVSIVADRPGVQAAGIAWYETNFDNALDSGAGVYIVNGRNPIDRMADALRRRAQRVDLSLLVYCEPREAARRVLADKEILEPTRVQLDEQQAKIEKRRQIDREPSRQFPFRDPGRVTLFEPGCCPYRAVEMSRMDTRGLEPPRHIYFDTTDMKRHEMREYAVSLADAALRVTVANR